MRGAAALLAGSAMLFASCSDDDAPMPDPELTLTPDTEISLPVGGGSVEVAVSTNLGSWTALSNETWCEVTLAEGKFTVSADANDALAARPTATVTVTAGEGERSITREVRVTQGAQTFTDLSAAGCANCYIVAPKSASVFDAAYKGNSSTESIGAAEGAELVWQSAQGLVTRVAYAADEKKIIVETADKSGNAVVAAVDESGTILWSWHLWIVDYDPSASLFTTAPNASGTTWSFMDRNLGALTVERGSFDSHGLLYQWGRKDPFPRPLDIVRSSATTVGDKELTANATTSAEVGTVSYTISNPDTRIFSANDWHNEWRNNGLWGNSDGLTKNVKTVYDPCPEGYCVPDQNCYQGFIFTSKTECDNNYGHLFVIDDSQTSYFPTGGYLDRGANKIAYQEYRGYQWTSNPGTTGAYYFYYNNANLNFTGLDRASAASVRCVRIE